MQRDLKIERDKDRHADERAHIAGPRKRRATHDRISENREREKRIAGRHQTPGEQAPQYGRYKEKPADLWRDPFKALTAPGQCEQQRNRLRLRG